MMKLYFYTLRKGVKAGIYDAKKEKIITDIIYNKRRCRKDGC